MHLNVSVQDILDENATEGGEIFLSEAREEVAILLAEQH
jgi:hypothetical protein